MVLTDSHTSCTYFQARIEERSVTNARWNFSTLVIIVKANGLGKVELVTFKEYITMKKKDRRFAIFNETTYILQPRSLYLPVSVPTSRFNSTVLPLAE